MARTHKPPTLGHDEYKEDVENERERNERNTREKEKEIENAEQTEKESKNERGNEKRQGKEEEDHRCVHGVPETAYGNGGVC